MSDDEVLPELPPRKLVRIPLPSLVALEPTRFGMQWRCLIVTCQRRAGFIDAETALDDFARHLANFHRAGGGLRPKTGREPRNARR